MLPLSCLVRKPSFCIWENKDADQLRGSREAVLRHCFRYLDRAIPLFSKLQASSNLHDQWLSSLFGRSRECHNKITKPIPSTKKKGKLSRTEITELQVNDSRKMSHYVRKPNFCICENKDTDQLRGYREADLHPCFRICKTLILLGIHLIVTFTGSTFAYGTSWQYFGL